MGETKNPAKIWRATGLAYIIPGKKGDIDFRPMEA
jgi:hypothetical protein